MENKKYLGQHVANGGDLVANFTHLVACFILSFAHFYHNRLNICCRLVDFVLLFLYRYPDGCRFDLYFFQ